MEEILLEVEPREELGKSKVKDLRKAGFIPGVIYAEGKESKSIKVSSRQLLRLIHQYRIESVVINLKVNPVKKITSTRAEISNGVKDDKKLKGRACLIKEIQYDPVKGDIIHIDFNEISLSKAIKVNVPVVAIGEPIGVKLEGGSLEHIVWEIEVECLPADIPKDIQVDVSQLKIGDTIHIKDITVPSNIKVLNAPEAIVLSVARPVKEEAPAAVVEGEEKQEPEVIKEKKEVPSEETGEKEKKEKEK